MLHAVRDRHAVPATEQQPVDHPADRLVGGDGLQAHVLHGLRRHRRGGAPDDGRQVEGVHDLLGQPDQVDAGDHRVDVEPGRDRVEVHLAHERVQVDPLTHQRGEVHAGDHRVDVDPGRDRVDVHLAHERVQVDPLAHQRGEVEPVDDRLDVDVTDHGVEVDLLGDDRGQVQPRQDGGHHGGDEDVQSRGDGAADGADRGGGGLLQAGPAGDGHRSRDAHQDPAALQPQGHSRRRHADDDRADRGAHGCLMGSP